MFDNRQGFDPSKRGYHAIYREHEVNICPGCSRTHWHIGRLTAECAFCATALPLAASFAQGPAAAPVLFRGSTLQPLPLVA